MYSKNSCTLGHSKEVARYCFKFQQEEGFFIHTYKFSAGNRIQGKENWIQSHALKKIALASEEIINSNNKCARSCDVSGNKEERKQSSNSNKDYIVNIYKNNNNIHDNNSNSQWYCIKITGVINSNKSNSNKMLYWNNNLSLMGFSFMICLTMMTITMMNIIAMLRITIIMTIISMTMMTITMAMVIKNEDDKTCPGIVTRCNYVSLLLDLFTW